MSSPDRFASLDIGSNTVRLLIAERAGEKVFRPLRLERKITRLGGNFSLQGYLAEESISRTVAAIRDFADLLKKEGVKELSSVATGVIRSAKNREEFLEKIKEESGIRPRVISGSEEARLTLKGVLWSLTDAPASHIVMDVGGWSTEILWVEEGNLKKAVSTDIGAVSACERFLLSDPPGAFEIERLDAHLMEVIGEVRQEFRRAGWISAKASSVLVGTAGTISTLAAIDLRLKEYDPQKINGHRIPLSKLESLFGHLAGLRAADRKGLPGLEEGREDLILSGTRIVLKAMEAFLAETLLVVDSGLLEGVLIEAIEKGGHNINSPDNLRGQGSK